jgi:carboxypeptidase Q
LGSRGYVDRHFAKVEYPGTPDIPTEMQRPVAITPKPEFGKLDVYFNSDAGGGRYLGISSEGNSAAANIFQQWARPLADLGFATVSLQHKTSIDSVVFNDVGLPGFEFMQDLRDYDTRTHHTNLDTYERLSEQDLKQAAIIMAVFVYNAAQRDTMFPLMPAPNPNAAANDKPLGVYPR